MKLKETETDILRAVRDYLRLKGHFVLRHQQGLGSHKGLSDLTAIKDGKTLWLEIKKPGGRLSEHQEIFRDEITHHGGYYFLIYSLEDIMDLLSRI